MKLFLSVFLLTVSSLPLFAQSNNSPYSILGIGDIEDSYFNRTSGMANTGIAYRNNNFLINNNPASYSALTNKLFNAEIGIRGTVMNYYGTGVDLSNNQSSDITFKKIIVGTKITNHWGSSAGLVPFSTQNYEFTATDATLGNDYYKGNGGVNRVYWGNSYEFFHHLSIGLNASYLFGTLQQKKFSLDANGSELYSQDNKVNITNGLLEYGLQYYGRVGRRWDFAIGGTYSARTNLLSRSTLIIRGADSIILYPVNGETIAEKYFTIPTSFGLGISVTRDKRYSFLADFKHQDWSSLHYTDYNNYSLQNSNRFSAGFEFSKKKNYYNTLVESKFFHAGFYYNQTYLYLKSYGQQIKDIGGTLGMGINSKRNLLSYTISVQYGVRGTPSPQIIQEKYASITFSISYRDIWNTSKVRYN